MTSVTAVKRIAILGGGLMGHGIALACLRRGDAEVAIISRRAESVASGLELIERGPFGLEKAVAKGKFTKESAGRHRELRLVVPRAGISPRDLR